MCSCHSILECCVTFSGVKLSIRSFLVFAQYWFILLDLHQLSSHNFGHLWFNLVNFGIFLLTLDHYA